MLLKEINNELLVKKNIIIRNCIKVDEYLFDREKEISDYLHDIKMQLDKLFNLKSSIEIQMEEKLDGKKQKKEERSRKEVFLQTFYAEVIEYYFLEQLTGWSRNEGIKIDVKTQIPDIFKLELEISHLTEEEKKMVNSGLMDIMNFQNEYAYLLYQIKRNTDINGEINFKNVLVYVLTRVKVSAKNTVDIYDKETVCEIIDLLEKLPKHYFKSKTSIKIKCDIEKTDEKIIDLLKCYDDCYKIRNNEDGSNNIFRLLAVELPKMSEGQRIFLDIVAKTVSAIYEIKPEDSLVLLIDEPDRALHPELARKFLNTLLHNVNKCKDRKVQIVLSSHSPFIVTDILPENVYAIEMKKGRRRIRNKEDTFATNIYYLLMDSFMLENTFGEYSYKKLKYIMEVLSSSSSIEKDQLDWIEKVIDRIGEQTVKKKLFQLYKNRDNYKAELVEQVIKETDENKIKKIREILKNND